MNGDKTAYTENQIRLAIAASLDPDNNWEKSAELFRGIITELYGIDLLIAVNISIKAFKYSNYKYTDDFIQILVGDKLFNKKEFLSVAEYLKAVYLKEKGKDEVSVIPFLKSSIELCDKYVMNYVLLSEYMVLDEKKALLEKAISNVDHIITAEELWTKDNSYYLDLQNCFKLLTMTEISEKEINNISNKLKNVDFEERYTYFKNTISNFGTFLISSTDKDISYRVFEEFDSDSVSFLHESSLKKIKRSGRITEEVYQMCIVLVKKFRALENTDFWNVNSVRTSPEWLEILKLSDQIQHCLTSMVDTSRCFDWFDRKVYSIYDTDKKMKIGFVTEYLNHPTVIRSIVYACVKDDINYKIIPGKIIIETKDGEEYTFECFPTSVFCGQFGITPSQDGERIYIISDIKGLWCYDKYGNIIWKTRYKTAGHVFANSNGNVTCITSNYIILVDDKGQAVRKRKIFDGFYNVLSGKNIAFLTSENVLSIIDTETLDDVLKIRLDPLDYYDLDQIIQVENYYVLFGITSEDIRLITVLDEFGKTLKRVINKKFFLENRGFIDKMKSSFVLCLIKQKKESE